MSIDEMLIDFEAYLARSPKRPSTVRVYTTAAKAFAEYCREQQVTHIFDVTPANCVDFLNRCDHAPDTVRAEIARVGSMFGRCVENRILDYNPFKHSDVRDMKPPSRSRKRIMTESEIAAFLAASEARNPIYADYFLLLLETGLRREEGLRLRFCDVRRGKNGPYLVVAARDGWAPKTASGARSVPLTARVAALKALRGKGEGSLWPESWSGRSVSEEFNRILDESGLERPDENGEKLVTHSLRHTYATRLLKQATEAGIPLSTVIAITGHSSIKELERYWHSSAPDAFKLVKGM